jgi:hypothetical protein
MMRTGTPIVTAQAGAVFHAQDDGAKVPFVPSIDYLA